MASLRDWYTKNGHQEVTVEEPADAPTISKAQQDKQLRQLLCFWEMMKDSPEQLTLDNTPFPKHAVEGIKEHLYAEQARARLPIPDRLVVLLTPMDETARCAVLSKLKRDTACLKLSDVRAKKPISSIIRHCMNKWPLEREFGVESLSLFPRHGTKGTRSSLHWSINSGDRVVDVARGAGTVETGTLELTYGWNAPAPSAPPSASSTDAPKGGSASSGDIVVSSPPVTEPAVPRPGTEEDLVEGVQVSGLEAVHLGAAFDAVASAPDGKPIHAADTKSMLATVPTTPAAVGTPLLPATSDANKAAAPEGSAPKRPMDEHVAAPVQKRPARFAGSEAAVLEIGAAARRVSLNQQTQRDALATATESTFVPVSSSGGIGGFDPNRWAANATAAAVAAASSSPTCSVSEKPFAGLSAASGCLGAVQSCAATASSATAAANSIFGRDDSLPVHQLDIDAGVSMGAIGASSS
eukprot:COSAG02_NODE_1001_length_15302_cov_22.687299_12_plen_467_part_00